MHGQAVRRASSFVLAVVKRLFAPLNQRNIAVSSALNLSSVKYGEPSGLQTGTCAQEHYETIFPIEIRRRIIFLGR